MDLCSQHKVLVAMLGARRHYAVPNSLHKVGALEHFYTDICGTAGWPKLLNYIPNSIRPSAVQRLTGRVPGQLPERKLTSFPSFGLQYALRLARARTLNEQIDVFHWAGESFASKVVQSGFGDADTVYIFDHNGVELLKKAKERGLKTVVDVTGPPLTIDQMRLQEEREIHPGWECEKNIPKSEAISLLGRMDRKAWKQADVLVCGSEYVKGCVVDEGAPEDRCVVAPYGLGVKAPKVIASKEYSPKLRVLTVGTVSLRKGAPYILEAAKRLKDHAVFRMVGSVQLLARARNELSRYVNLFGPEARQDVRRHYEWADVFLLPSINEGSAAVTYEALAFGLPVICTPNTGSVVRDGIEGYIVQPRDVDAITERLMQLHASLSRRREMMDMARRRAEEFTPASYGRALLSAISQARAM